MAGWKRLILGTIIFTSMLGIVVAFYNLPVLTKCGYYGRCGTSAVSD